MILTQRQLDVLNHVVLDGQAWADNAKSEQHMLDKVARWESDYDQAVAQGNYKNRATKEAELKAQEDAEKIANAPLYEIRRLEAQVTQRRIREAIAGTDGGWMANQESLIAIERAKL